jgi:predicted DNA-binding transcriptional regulator AlpA
MPAETMISAPSQDNVKKVFWRYRDLPDAIGLSHRTIARLRASGRLPKPDAVFGTALCWRPETIQQWASTGGIVDQNASR